LMCVKMDSTFNLTGNSDYNTEEDDNSTSLEELFSCFIESLEMELSKLKIQIGVVAKTIKALRQIEIKLNGNDNINVEKEKV